MLRPTDDARLTTASLLVAFYVLDSATTAYAECAWVLWPETESTVKRASDRGTLTLSPSWKAVQAETSKPACEAKRTSVVAGLMEATQTHLGATATIYSDVITLTWADSDPLRVRDLVAYHCLPDTVDPSGPKGGGR